MATRAQLGRIGAVTLAFLLLATPATQAARYPEGFSEEVVIDGLVQPTQAAFTPDGRIVVAEKRGVVKVFDGPGDASPDVLVDLSLLIHDYWDRGMLGLAVDPGFPERPYVYVLYTHNFDPADPDAGTPRWPTNDCPAIPGPNTDGCVVNGRLSRLEVDAQNQLVGGEHVLLEGGWCSQFPSHSVGALAFDGAGALYVTAGDGASSLSPDWGQFGGSPDSPVPRNPCGDPPGGRGASLFPPAAEGGSLRAQDLRTDGDPVTWSGSVVRIDPDTGAAWPTNPRVGGDADDDRVVAYGLRNPFRMVRRPGTDELWIGDVGWRAAEEINRLTVPTTGNVPNFGWPCYEGAERQPGFDEADLAICESLYTDQQNPALDPYFSYNHSEPLDPSTDPEAFRCSRYGSSAITGLAFIEGDAYPTEYDGALFFADFPRHCIFVMQAGADGLPDPATRKTFGDGIAVAVQLLAGPDGALHYLNLASGSLVRIAWNETNTTPVAIATADVTSGLLPLTVHFDAASSNDPDDGATLTYDWDLDGDGQFGDSILIDPAFTYDVLGEYVVGLRVTDERGASSVAALNVTAGNSAPAVTIVTPASTVTWRTGDEIAFSGTALDTEDGLLAATTFNWEVVLYVCDDDGNDCTPRTLSEFHGVSAGTFIAPDEPGLSWLELRLSVTDDGFGPPGDGALTSQSRRELQPETVALTFDTRPSGLVLRVDGAMRTTPFTRTTVIGATSEVGVPDPQPGVGGVHRFFFWSDGGAATHGLTAPAETTRLTAEFVFDCLEEACTPVLRVSPQGAAVAPFTAVQAAIDAVSAGGRIEVLPGTYVENLVVDRGFPIAIVARDDGTGGSVTIDGGAGTALEVSGAAAVTLRGLTFDGAVGIRAAATTRLSDLHFGAVTEIALDLTAGTHDVRDVRVAPGAAAGISVATDATLRLDRARIEAVSGTGLHVAGRAHVRNLLVHGSGVGISTLADAALDLAHATIVNNQNGGVVSERREVDDTTAITITAAILWNNRGSDHDNDGNVNIGADAVGVTCAELTWTNSGRIDCAGAGGNVASDPRLDATFTPIPGSSMLDAGPTPGGSAAAPCNDLNGTPRWLDHDGDGVPRVDLGAFERANPDLREAVVGLFWNSPTDIQWTAPAWAREHHIYRGSLAELLADAGLPCRDGLDPDRSDSVLHDVETPGPGRLFVYLVTAEDAFGLEGSAGLSTCAERTRWPACPR